jgi:hypothetical protein
MNELQRWWKFLRADRQGRTPAQRREAAARRKRPVPGADAPPSADGGGAHRSGRAPAPGLPEGCYYSIHFCTGPAPVVLDDHERGNRVAWARPGIAREAEQWLKDGAP